MSAAAAAVVQGQKQEPVKELQGQEQPAKKTQQEAKSWIPSFSMPSMAWTNNVLHAGVYGAFVAGLAGTFAPAYAVTVLTGAVAGAATQLASYAIADRVHAYAQDVLAVVAGSLVATVGAVALGTIALSACTLSLSSAPLQFFALAALSASVSRALNLLGNYQVPAKA